MNPMILESVWNRSFTLKLFQNDFFFFFKTILKSLNRFETALKSFFTYFDHS